ncbi:ABC transporter permease [Arenimonas fontis]|uniref:ABC transporter permease n=1 Tax=Arenimonas fontis TaxID=2608255 RepID=A0A5B2Z8I1_9GAMM|nr:ABC transporter permease [Arenimonas fontis]KAA2284207.1 ABC transporter permease [Arenimonas fontis]
MNAIVHSHAGAPAPSLARVYLSEAWYELLRLLRTPAFSVPTLLFPAVFYGLFGIVLPGSYGSLDKATYLLATFGVFGVIGPALFGFGVGMAIEREQGWLELKRVSPMPPGAYFFAKIATGLLFALAVLLLLSTLGFAFGNVKLGLGRWLLLVATLLLGTLPFSALGLFVGALVRGQAAVAVVNLVYLPMAVLSGLWIPLFAFPAILQKLAVVWPAWHLAQLALGVAGQGSTANAVGHVLVLLAWTVVFLSLAARRLRR